MIDRRAFLTASAAAVACCTLGLPARAHNCFDHCGDGVCKGLCAHPSWPRDAGLKLAWDITSGETPQGMHRALVANFGEFPIWFIDDQAHVVILGVENVPEEILDRLHHSHQPLKGYWLCDVRIIRMRNDRGEWEMRDTLDRPSRFDGGYVTG